VPLWTVAAHTECRPAQGAQPAGSAKPSARLEQGTSHPPASVRPPKPRRRGNATFDVNRVAPPASVPRRSGPRHIDGRGVRGRRHQSDRRIEG